MGAYDGERIHSIVCPTCRHYTHDKSSSLPHKCNSGIASSSCAARSDNGGYKVITQSSCGYFEQRVSESAAEDKKASGGALSAALDSRAEARAQEAEERRSRAQSERLAYVNDSRTAPLVKASLRQAYADGRISKNEM
jgi:hypothetical protein